MSIACVLITHLRAKVELRRHPRLRDKPAVIVDRSGGSPLVVDCLPATSGVRVGTPLEQALSRHPDTVVLEGDESSYRRVFHGILADLQRVSDRVEGSDLGITYVGMDGLEELYGGEARLVNALLNCVPRDLAPRVGVAEAKFPAFVAALTCNVHGVFRVTEDVAAFLAPHTIDLLPVSSDVKRELHRFGLHTMGAIASMDMHLLTDRFGSAGGRSWRLCNGIDDSPIVPLVFEEKVVEHTSLPFHSSSLEALFVAVDALLKRAYARPDMRGRYADGADLLFAASGWPNWEKSVSFKQPVGTWDRASEILQRRLETDPPRNPVEDLTLTLSGFTGESGTQLGLLRDVSNDRNDRLVEADRRLQPLMGGGHALHRIAEVAPWHPVPEMRTLQVPIDPSGRETMRSLHTPRTVEVREGVEDEPVSVLIKERWRNVSRIDDRWTFDLWWMPTPMTRAYYRVRLEEGRQATLFRDLGDGRWYKQGL